MSNLAEKVQSCTVSCGECGHKTFIITKDQADRMVEVCRSEFIEAIEDIHPYAKNSNGSTSMKEVCLQVVRELK